LFLFLVKDFDHFTDRNIAGMSGIGTSPTDNVWQKMLMNLKGKEWKETRSTFTPIFTSGKMKTMVQFMQATSEELAGEMGKAAKSESQLELKDVCAKFSMETIASCVFGINAGSFKSSDSPFVKSAQEMFSLSAKDALRIFGYFLPGVRQIADAMKYPIMKPQPIQFLIDSITQTIKHRLQSKSRRNDMIDLMIDAMKGELRNEDQQIPRLDNQGRSKVVDETMIIATATVMLVAGYETTGSTMSFIFWLLARNPHIQERLQSEIDEACDGSTEKNGMPDYDSIQQMEYLEMVIMETLRLIPPAGISFRECTADYKLPGGAIIKRGTEIHIPILGIHTDERYYPNPEEFDPERFTKEAQASRHPMAFLPFSHGPRMCIGMRFALLEIKVAIVKVLREYTVKTCTGTPTRIVTYPDGLTTSSKDPLLVKIVARK
jgi:cytochrome P450